MKRIKIILAHCTVKSNNRGCEALGVSAMHLLHELFTQKGIQYTLYYCNGNWPKSFGPTVYKINDSEEIPFKLIKYPWGRTVKETIKLLLKPVTLFKSIKTFLEADYILNVSQGDSFSDIYGVDRFKEIDSVHILARLLHKKYALLPQTIGPFIDNGVQRAAAKSLRYAAFIMARDRQSLDCTHALAPESNYSEYVDMAFFMPYQKCSFDSQYVHVGLNISSLLWNGGYTRNNQFGLKEDYQQLIHGIIKYFLSKDNVKLHLVAHNVLSEPNIENDYEKCCEIYHLYNHPNMVLGESFITPIAAKNYIAGLDFFMGARMHATIAAFSSGTPVLPMAYSRKFNGLFVETLGYNHLIDMKADSMKNILKCIDEAYRNRNNLMSEIDAIMDEKIPFIKMKINHSLSSFFFGC